MTLLVSWIGVDTHGPTSAYIVADSRISWGLNSYFDYAKKVFASKSYPEIFGYAGDVLFPSIALSQILEMIDREILFTRQTSCSEKNHIVYEKLRYIFAQYPSDALLNPIQIIHITRDTEFQKYPEFHQYILTWDKRNGWRNFEQPIPNQSDILKVLGTGRDVFIENYSSRYQTGLNKSTSRNVFHCYMDTLEHLVDWQCGGPPQLVGIYRKPLTAAMNFGIIYRNRRYFLGTEIPLDSDFEQIEWRNELFELCDGTTKKRLEVAAKQNDSMRHK